MPLDRRAFIRFIAGCVALTNIVPRSEAKDDSLTVPIRREPIESRSITSIGYHAELRVLEIEFRRGAIYRFFSVPPSVFEGLQKAESKGRYFSQSVRGKFEFQHVAEVKR
jgi:hypothetical protein